MKLTLNIQYISIVLLPGKDELYFETDLPYQYPNLRHETSLMALRLTCPPATGVEYCKTYFPQIPLIIKDCR